MYKKKLVIRARVIDPLMRLSVVFLDDIEVTSGTGAAVFEAIQKELCDRGVDIQSKVYGLGTDGASAMTRKGKGLAGYFL